MSEIMLRWGAFAFSVETAAYDSLRLETHYRWPVQERLGRAPALQYLGPGVQTIELEGTIYPAFRGGLDQLQQVREQAAQGEPQLLVDGRGRIQGKWVAMVISETSRTFLPGGIPRQITFNLTLQRYGEEATPSVP